MAAISRKHFPGTPLSAFVKCFWYWAAAPQTHVKERLLPNGEPSIVFNLREELSEFSARLIRHRHWHCASHQPAKNR